jgi:hypothetical protein
MSRRSRGEGSIYKRKDGRWCGKYTDASGKTRYVYGKTKGDVWVKLTKAIAEKDRGIVFDAGTLAVGEYLDRWLDSIEDSLRPGAFRRYEEVSRIHIKPTLDSLARERRTRGWSATGSASPRSTCSGAAGCSWPRTSVGVRRPPG